MTPDPAQVDVADLRARLEAATPGPWESGTDGWVETVSGDGEDWCFVRQVGQTSDITAQMLHGQESDEQTEADAAYIAAARNALPALLDRLEAAEAKVAAVEALADELANPDATLITPIERAHRRTVSRELRAALRLKGDG